MRNVLTALVLIAVIGAILYLEKSRPLSPRASTATPVDVALTKEEKEGRYERAKEITTPDGFLNSDPFTLADHIGKKVILLDIWTYSCINCQRTIPYLNSWWKAYEDQGLLIVGLHTPEFEFEKEIENVRKAATNFGIGYPVVLDNDYSTWRAYRNQYWPRKYLIDIDGYVVYDHIGEGGYDETEAAILAALQERSVRLGFPPPVARRVAPVSSVADATPRVGSPEVYFGADRNELLGNGRSGSAGEQMFFLPKTIERNTLYLGGSWRITPEYAESAGSASIIFRYRAKEVYMVASAEEGVEIEIFRDGKALGSMAGEDVSAAESRVSVQDERLYKLIRDTVSGEHTIEIRIKNAGFRAFTFTFG
ncbi:MAG: Thiol-disulfide isomerase [Parcubacteria group bacterium Gr01-1014_72]|nr:MAG: Thiol-disulfide isomerase [Parcubacteria group bacterium Gr01-1014_72]